MALSGEIDQWWRARNEMTVVQKGSGWEIERPRLDRARIAYETLDGERLKYVIYMVENGSRAFLSRGTTDQFSIGWEILDAQALRICSTLKKSRDIDCDKGSN